MLNELVPTKINSEERKSLGIFYTPPALTEILCNWAIKTPDDLVLEPSFGGCGFLESSFQRLKQLGCKKPVEHLFGCDVDEKAFRNYLLPKYSDDDPNLSDRFIWDDFLDISLEDFPAQHFSTAIGNPPYISYHRMSKDQRASAFDKVAGVGVRMDKRASLWAYFVLHSLSFLKEGGRIAFVLPGSFLHSYYSKAVWNKLSSHFSRSLVIQVGEKLFSSEGTDENTAILFADGYSLVAGGSPIEIKFAGGLPQIAPLVSAWSAGKDLNRLLLNRVNHELLSDSAFIAFNKFKETLPIVTVGDIADIKIGVVTGANHFFIKNKKVLDEWEIPLECREPILSKFRMAEGLCFTGKDLREKSNDNFSCILINTGGKARVENKNLRSYLASFHRKDRRKNVTFGKRPFWHHPQYLEIPDAFFPYMHNSGPKIVLNKIRVICTNTIHRIFFKKIQGKRIKLAQKNFLALSILSTFSQLSAEMEGRIYGSGALKHEPSEAKNIEVVFPKQFDEQLINVQFRYLDKLIRELYSESASNSNEIIRQKADEFILAHFKEINLEKELDILSAELKILRDKRR